MCFSLRATTRRHDTEDTEDEEDRERREWKKSRWIQKLLLLGTAESGKSTVAKQMTIIHKNGFSDDERREWIPKILKNVRDAISSITGAMTHIKPPVELANPDNAFRVEYIQQVANEPNFNYPHEFFEHVNVLWVDAGVRECYRRSNEYQLIDSAQYFLDRIEQIERTDYIPDDQDILRCRVLTSGVFRIEFRVGTGSNEVIFHMFDVGGQREEHRKWIQCFNDITAIIFVSASSSYNLVLNEDSSQNRVTESLRVFRAVWTNRFLVRISVILFLNKQDVLKKKITDGNFPIQHYFPPYENYKYNPEPEKETTYCGCFHPPTTKHRDQQILLAPRTSDNTQNDDEYVRAKHFFRDKYVEIVENPFANEDEETAKRLSQLLDLSAKRLYPHFTCAVDTENIGRVFNSCRDIIQRWHISIYFPQ